MLPESTRLIFVITLSEYIFPPLNHNHMGNLLYVIAVILLVSWAIGFFAFSAGSVIHVLLVIAIIAILFKVIQGRRIL